MCKTNHTDPTTPALVLASASARRHELLASAGVPHQVIVSTVPETPEHQERPLNFAVRVARSKAESVAATMRSNGDTRPVLAADTIVTLEGKILGKPRDHEDARRMITLLAGREHQVVTAYCLLTTNAAVEDAVITKVRFRRLTPAQIERYLQRASWADKAGAYAIQAEAGSLVLAIEGSHSNVIGLPLCEVLERLRDLPTFRELV
ncbi:MAG: septum formation protein Maf [Deltaproteobacteria bacterium]|nr:septum formation protein Maf [Deltaproteobacteria bacterium]